MASDEVGKVATPLPFRFPVPRVFVPSRKVTVPLGVPLPDVTVAVNVTGWLSTEGFAFDARVVVVVASTVWFMVFDVLAAKVAAPLYAATTVWEPAVRVELLNVATPEPFRFTV